MLNGRTEIKPNMVALLSLVVKGMFGLYSNKTKPVRTTVRPTFRVKQASAAIIADRKNAEGLSVLRNLSISKINKSTNIIKSGSVQANADISISFIDNKIAIEPSNAIEKCLRFFKNQRPEINIINPKAIAFTYLTASKGSIPPRPTIASNVGSKGGSNKYRLPSNLR